MSAREALRAATRAEHDRVDALFSRFDLSSLPGYRAFLAAQAGAFLPIEAALDANGIDALVPDWAERRRGHLLRADLAELDKPVPTALETNRLQPAPLPRSLTTPAALLGTLYVLEGSRLGGAVLRRAVPPAAPQRFLSAPQPAGGWRKLLALLDESLYAIDTIEVATRAARQAFALFEEAARWHLEPSDP